MSCMFNDDVSVALSFIQIVNDLIIKIIILKIISLLYTVTCKVFYILEASTYFLIPYINNTCL